MSLTLESITKRFGVVTAVDDVTIETRGGEFVVLLGPSGCGKSTLLRTAAGLESPDTGRVLIGGRDVTALEPRDRDVAMVFQSYALYPHMTVAENIAYPLRIRKRPSREIAAEVHSVATRLGLAELADRRPRELSGGQRQRVALARAIVRRPKAFLMDEPLSNLDARLRVEMRFELRRLQHDLRTATLYVTHDQAEAMTLADRIAVIHQGRLEQFDTPSVVYHKPANRFVAGFLGSPSMNFVGGDITRAYDPPRASAVLGVRPEDVEVSLREQSGWHAGRVWVAEEMGSETLFRIDCGTTRITARAAAGVRADFESPVWFRFDRTKLHWFDAESGVSLRPG